MQTAQLMILGIAAGVGGLAGYVWMGLALGALLGKLGGRPGHAWVPVLRWGAAAKGALMSAVPVLIARAIALMGIVAVGVGTGVLVANDLEATATVRLLLVAGGLAAMLGSLVGWVLWIYGSGTIEMRLRAPAALSWLAAISPVIWASVMGWGKYGRGGVQEVGAGPDDARPEAASTGEVEARGSRFALGGGHQSGETAESGAADAGSPPAGTGAFAAAWAASASAPSQPSAAADEAAPSAPSIAGARSAPPAPPAPTTAPPAASEQSAPPPPRDGAGPHRGEDTAHAPGISALPPGWAAEPSAPADASDPADATIPPSQPWNPLAGDQSAPSRQYEAPTGPSDPAPEQPVREQSSPQEEPARDASAPEASQEASDLDGEDGPAPEQAHEERYTGPISPYLTGEAATAQDAEPAPAEAHPDVPFDDPDPTGALPIISQPVPDPTPAPDPAPASLSPLPPPARPEADPSAAPEPASEPAQEGTGAGDDDEDDRTVIAARRRETWVLAIDGGDTYVLPEGGAVIGRATATPTPGRVGVRDATRTMSKVHAELVWAEGAWTVRDLGSTNGTYLRVDGDERRVEGEAVPVEGDLLLGDLEARIVRDEEGR